MLAYALLLLQGWLCLDDISGYWASASAFPSEGSRGPGLSVCLCRTLWLSCWLHVYYCPCQTQSEEACFTVGYSFQIHQDDWVTAIPFAISTFDLHFSVNHRGLLVSPPLCAKAGVFGRSLIWWPNRTLWKGVLLRYRRRDLGSRWASKTLRRTLLTFTHSIATVSSSWIHRTTRQSSYLRDISMSSSRCRKTRSVSGWNYTNDNWESILLLAL